MGADFAYHQQLFRWHCDTFFRFDDELTAGDLAYLHRCFGLAQDYAEHSPSGFEHFSYYSYSHRVRGSEVNSSRIAYGSVHSPDEAWKAAEEVVRQRDVGFDPYFVASSNSFFYGLGWDIEAGHFKLYFRIGRLADLPQEKLRELAAVPKDCRDEGLVSFTYQNKQLIEEKAYAYPRSSVDSDRERRRTLRSTDRRGVVPQVDVSDPPVWMKKLNDTGRRIIRLYSDIDEPLDTIAYTDPDNFTLYFP